jgi:putative transcriptional regulator
MNMTIKKTVGSRIIEGLTEFAEALESGEPLEMRLTSHWLSINLMPRKYRPRDVRATRRLLGASQSHFARFLGVALGTVRAWEQGRNVPNGAAARLLDEIRLNPGFWKTRFASVLRRRTSSPPRAVRRGKLHRVRVTKTGSAALLTHPRGRKTG